jgi:hypothetical protein
MDFSFFSVPPSFASLLALSTAIRVCNPNLTRDVFSEIPVNLAAFSSNSSSILSVVLNTHLMICKIICIYMPFVYNVVNLKVNNVMMENQ